MSQKLQRSFCHETSRTIMATFFGDLLVNSQVAKEDYEDLDENEEDKQICREL